MAPKRRKQPRSSTSSSSSSHNNIPLPYWLFHLYIEPILLVPGGIYLSLFQREQFLRSTTTYPALQSLTTTNNGGSANVPLITPVTTQLLTNTAGLYCVFMLNELLVLRLSSDLRVWRAVVTAMLLCDGLHLWGVWVAGGGWEWVASPELWRLEDWINQVVLLIGVILRVGFLTGVGLR